MTNCEYFDLPVPLALDEVAHPLRKLKLKNGPINSKGTVNQGYLYGLNRVAALVISARLKLAELPEPLVAVLAPLVDSRWELFVHWASRIFTSGNVRENER